MIRQNFIHEGKLTIEMKKPAVNLMIREARESDLKILLEEIQADRKRSANGDNDATPNPECGVKSSKVKTLVKSPPSALALLSQVVTLLTLTSSVLY